MYLGKLKFILLAFALLGLIKVNYAQPFEIAPAVSKKRVKHIIEWVRSDLKEKSKEGMRSDFNKKGKLTAYYKRGDDPSKKTVLKYDKRGRVIEKREKHDEYEWKAIYAYQKDKTIEEIKFRGKTRKVFYYRNKKGQLIEKKTFMKGLELGNQFLLNEQVFYYYNKRDSLKSEKILRFDLIPNKRSKRYDTRKAIHSYSGKTGKRIKTIEYDFDGAILKETFFEYDNSSRLTKKTTHYKIENTISTEHIKYQNGKIWQEIFQHPGYKNVKVFVDGRPIRLRCYNEDKLFRVVDYQYIYY